MKLPKLIPATIKKRYKRFLADVVLDSGEEITVYVPNTGSMKNCWGENWPVMLSKSDNSDRKYQYTLEMTKNGDYWIGINTSLTNKIVHEALEAEQFIELKGLTPIKSEVKTGKSRLDFLLGDDTYVEVKNVTLVDDEGNASFPDAVTKRGSKHLDELIEINKSGKRAVMLYLIQREGIKTFSTASEIDPKYAYKLEEAKKAGVEILVYSCNVSPSVIKIDKKITFPMT